MNCGSEWKGVNIKISDNSWEYTCCFCTEGKVVLLKDDFNILELDEEEKAIRKVKQQEHLLSLRPEEVTQITVFRGSPYAFDCMRNKLRCFTEKKWSSYSLIWIQITHIFYWEVNQKPEFITSLFVS